jgi:hypothetical protein
VVRFQTPSYQDSRQALRDRFNFDMGTAAQVFSLADGRLGQALTLCENFEKIEMLRGLRKSHTRFLNDIEAYSEDLQETLEKADDLEAAVKSMSEVLSSSYFPLKISRKAFCRSYILQSAVPAAFPLLFTDSFLERIEVSRKKMKKHFDAIVAESKASYQSGILKEAESVFSACINSWVHNQIIDLFSCFESFYEDAIRWSCCQDETLLLNLDQKEDIITLSKVEDIVLLNRRISLLNESVGLLKRYIQPSFIIENVLTQIGGLAA